MDFSHSSAYWHCDILARPKGRGFLQGKPRVEGGFRTETPQASSVGVADAAADEITQAPTDKASEPSADESVEESVRVWLVERTYSDDEQNLIILVYATLDGENYLRKERALTSFSDVRPTTAAIDADSENLGHVDDPETREWYDEEASRMAAKHDPSDTI